MDSAFLPRAHSDETLAWLAPHLDADQPVESIVAAIEAAGTPVYRLEHRQINALMWQLCRPKTGFIALSSWQTRLASLVLRIVQPKPFPIKTVGFFWYPIRSVSPAILSYDVHHWRMTNPVDYTTALWQARLHDPVTLNYDVQHLDESELADLQRAVNQELDALTALRSTLLQERNQPT
jgi:hypothetical protein